MKTFSQILFDFAYC